MRALLRTILLVLIVTFPVSSSAVDELVVIPLFKQSHGTGEVFLSAPSFRPVTPMLGFSWEEDGMVIKPNGAGWWIAPLDMPTGVTITSLELIWENTSQATNIPCYVTLYVFNLSTGHGLDMSTVSSTLYQLGLQNLKTKEFKFTITENYKSAIRVYLGSAYKSLIGVKVYYSY
nr:hypothetical protein [uncultured Desulfobulbus sp.]